MNGNEELQKLYDTAYQAILDTINHARREVVPNWRERLLDHYAGTQFEKTGGVDAKKTLRDMHPGELQQVISIVSMNLRPYIEVCFNPEGRDFYHCSIKRLSQPFVERSSCGQAWNDTHRFGDFLLKRGLEAANAEYLKLHPEPKAVVMV